MENILIQSSSGRKSVALIRPPFFTPMSPPLGLAMMKSYVEHHGHTVRCFDFNVDSDLWATLRNYFAILERSDTVGASSGYSTFWSILNTHLLAHLAGATAETSSRIISAIAPRFGLRLADDCGRPLHALVDRLFSRVREMLDSCDFSGFDVIGTSTYTTSLAPSLFVLRRLKTKYPAAKTLIGGGIFADDLAMGSTNLEILSSTVDYIDHIVIGEGEAPLLALLQSMNGNGSHAVDGRGDGVQSTSGSLGKILALTDVGNKPIDLKQSLAPDFGDFDMDSYSHLSIEGGRSCPYQCSFCSETIQWGTYRKKPEETLAEQMVRTAQTYRRRRYFMGDSLMNPYINGLSRALVSLGGDVLYDGYLRADGPVGELERVETWAKSGLYRARLGLETASNHLLQIINKRTTPEKMLSALKTLSAHGVRTTTYWVVGHPGETEEDFKETLEFVSSAHQYIYELEAHPFFYYPYGQVASRLYESEPVYDNWINDIVQFRTWDVVNVSPTRAERFDRLRRFSDLTRSLGIPNIYTMEELLAAEDRWLRLAPNALRLD